MVGNEFHNTWQSVCDSAWHLGSLHTKELVVEVKEFINAKNL